MMTANIAINCLIIFCARVVDVSLGTLRTLAMVRGSRLAAWGLGFCEILIWLMVITQIIQNISDTPVYAVFYALGYATGGYVGITIEHWLAFGDKVVLLFTRRGDDVAASLRGEGYIVTEWVGKGKQGLISLLFAKVPRKKVRNVIRQSLEIDANCFYVVESVDSTLALTPTLVPRTGWRAVARKAK